MGLYVAIIIIIILIVYSLKDVFSNADIPALSNMVITGLILFTVILSIFLILHYRSTPSGEDKNIKTKQEQTQTTAPEEIPQEEQPSAEEELSPRQEQAIIIIAQDYIIMEDYYKRNFPKENSYDKASEYIMKKYSLSQEEWSSLLDNASKYGLFKEAQKQIDYNIKNK